MFAIIIQYLTLETNLSLNVPFSNLWYTSLYLYKIQKITPSINSVFNVKYDFFFTLVLFRDTRSSIFHSMRDSASWFAMLSVGSMGFRVKSCYTHVRSIFPGVMAAVTRMRFPCERTRNRYRFTSIDDRY